MTPDWVLLGIRLLLAATLYGFLGLLLWYLRQDFQSTQRQSSTIPIAQIVILAGPGEGSIHRLGLLNEIGRAADNTIPIKDETVSAYHARITHHAGQWWIEDLGSKNGTRVNELLVEEPLVVTYGDEIHMGNVLVRLEARPSTRLRSEVAADEERVGQSAGDLG